MVQKKKSQNISTTQVVVILDRSGSMESIKNDVIGGFNALIAEQKKLKVPVEVNLVQFDDIYEIVYEARKIGDVDNLNDGSYQPRGCTALLDAIGKTLNNFKSKYDKNSRVSFTIITDGLENASREWNGQGIKSLIESCKKDFDWDVVFIGSNQDAVTTARQYGIASNAAMTFGSNAVGVNNMMRSVSSRVSLYAGGASAATMDFSEVERNEAMGTTDTITYGNGNKVSIPSLTTGKFKDTTKEKQNASN